MRLAAEWVALEAIGVYVLRSSDMSIDNSLVE